MKRVQQLGLQKPFYLILAVALLFTACKKGDPGPQGEKGEKGDTGTKGDKGDPGSANIMYSAWMDLQYSLDTTANIFFVLINETRITDAFLSSGEIKVYMNFGTPANKIITALPYYEGADVSIVPFFGVGGIELDATINASSFTDTNGNKRLQYRYVLIPGGTALRTSQKINWNNYEEVKKYLGLQD